jgi:hypothetical protein
MIDKPKLHLPSNKQKPMTPVSPVEEIPEQPWAAHLRLIIAEELERADNHRGLALNAAMSRIVADDALFRNLATIMIRHACRKRIKGICRNLTEANQAKKLKAKQERDAQ